MKNLITLMVRGTGRCCMGASLIAHVLARVRAMQCTVSRFDQATRAGELLTDAGLPLDFPASSLADHIRHLRVGQRVFVELAGETVTSIRIWP